MEARMGRNPAGVRCEARQRDRPCCLAGDAQTPKNNYCLDVEMGLVGASYYLTPLRKSDYDFIAVQPNRG